MKAILIWLVCSLIASLVWGPIIRAMSKDKDDRKEDD